VLLLLRRRMSRNWPDHMPPKSRQQLPAEHMMIMSLEGVAAELESDEHHYYYLLFASSQTSFADYQA